MVLTLLLSFVFISGAAHGICAILQILLSFPEYLKADASAERDVRETVDFLLRLQTPNGNFPCAMDEVQAVRPESEELVHWCHGAPGKCNIMLEIKFLYATKRRLI